MSRSPKQLVPPEITEGFYYRDSDHKYFLDGKPMTGCTTILGVIAKPALIQWAADECIKEFGWVKKDYGELEDEYQKRLRASIADSIQKISTLPFEEQVTLICGARTAHAKKRDDGASKGTDTHALVEQYVKESIAKYNGQPKAIYDSTIEGFALWAMRENIRFIASEEKLYSKELWVAGTADLIFEKDGKRYVGDIKTYKKIWDRVPFIQCAGYALMYEEMLYTHAYKKAKSLGLDEKTSILNVDGMPGIDGYCIINLPKERAFNESEDIKWSFDVEGDTKAFKAAVTLYRTLENF